MIQKILITSGNYIYRLTKELSENVRNAGLLFCCFLLMDRFYFYIVPMHRTAGNLMVYGSLLISIMTVLSINLELKPVKVNRFAYYSMIIFGIGSLIIGFIHPVGDGYVMYALDLALLFPAFYFVWINRGDHETLFKTISFVIMTYSLIGFLICINLAFKGELYIENGRICGFKEDPNLFAMLGVLSVIAGIYLLMEYSDRLLYWILSPICVGIGTVFIVLPVSRTAILALGTDFLVFMIFAIKNRKSGGKPVPGMWKKLLLSFLLMLIVLIIGLSLDNWNLRVLEEKNKVQAEQSATREEAVSTEAPPVAAEETKSVSERWDTENGVNAFSSGRIDIWKVYIRNFSWLGGDLKSIEPELEGLLETRAHNNIIDYLFRYGYIVGSFYIVFYISVGISGLIILFSKRYNRPRDCFLVMVIGTYSLNALIEIATLPFSRCIPCLFFLTLAPVMEKLQLSGSQKDKQGKHFRR